MSRPYPALFSSRRRLTLAASLGGLLASQGALATSLTVSPQQRSTAQQVAGAGVPLSELAPNAPDTYTVKRGDTLWGISRLFLRSPWRWPELWGMNLDQVKNPHLIYPGQLLVLLKKDGQARLVIGQTVSASLDEPRNGRLGPRVRELPQLSAAIASVPMHLIGPFLNEAVVFDTEQQLAAAPRIVATQEGRVLVSRGETAYVRGDLSGARTWQMFRQPQPLIDPQTQAILGYEARHVGVADVQQLGEADDPEGERPVRPSTILITQLRQEATDGDRLAPLPPRDNEPFAPRAPGRALEGRVVQVYGDGVNAGQNQIVSINLGAQDGLERGHVLALWRAGTVRPDRTSEDRAGVQLPDERSGLLFVFRVFERVSYALIVSTQDPVRRGDRFTQP